MGALLVDEKLNITQQCVLTAQKGNLMLVHPDMLMCLNSIREQTWCLQTHAVSQKLLESAWRRIAAQLRVFLPLAEVLETTG